MAFHKNWEGIVIKEVTWWEAGRNKNKRRESQSERSPTKRKRKNISKPKKSLKTSWPLGASKIQQCVILGSSLTRRLQGSCHRSDSKRTKGPLSDNVFISRLLLNFFIDIFLYTILFVIIFLKWVVCVSQCDRMLAISYFELTLITSSFFSKPIVQLAGRTLTTWGLRLLWWWFRLHRHFSWYS